MLRHPFFLKKSAAKNNEILGFTFNN